MDEARLLGLLTGINTWWNGDPVPESLLQAEYRRRDFFVLKKRMHDDFEVIPIRGPRQVGKTTVVGQLIDSLLDENDVPPERILYLNMETSQFLSSPENTIQQALDVYETSVLGQSFQRMHNPVYVFIDEIQKADEWASTVKYYTDTFACLRFVVTGSISTLIDQEAKETLVGRRDPFTMLPMKYVEYVRYREIRNEETIKEFSNDLRDALKRAVLSGDMNEFTPIATRTYGLLDPVRPELNTAKEDYLLKGGYPRVIDMNYADAFNRLNEDLRSTVTGDIPNVFPAEKPEKLLRLLNLVAYSTGSKFTIQKMSDETGLNHRTVEDYLTYLEEFFLITRSERYSASEYGSRGQKKIYVQDPGHLNALEGTLSERTLGDGEQMGKVLEAACRTLGGRLQYYLLDQNPDPATYWDKNGEVDVVLGGPDFALPIEVKRGDSAERDLRGLRNFLAEYDHAPFGFAVNDAGTFEEDDNVVHIPAWLFFFMC